ncbi:MAG: hypothetical protein Q8Q23_06015 [bacterium]|nr:hypothetical protein [bacterium]
MEKLSLKLYGWKCVLGTGVFYVACLIYGAFLSGAAAELHHALFALLPGFTWGTMSGVIIGAIDLFVFAWIFAWYYVWMHNTSLVKK